MILTGNGILGYADLVHVLHRLVVGHQGEAADHPYENQRENLETSGEIPHVFAGVLFDDVPETIDGRERCNQVIGDIYAYLFSFRTRSDVDRGVIIKKKFLMIS